MLKPLSIPCSLFSLHCSSPSYSFRAKFKKSDFNSPCLPSFVPPFFPQVQFLLHTSSISNQKSKIPNSPIRFFFDTRNEYRMPLFSSTNTAIFAMIRIRAFISSTTLVSAIPEPFAGTGIIISCAVSVLIKHLCYNGPS
jgi:hypothetical protein